MATRPPENTALIQEVDDALRQDNLLYFWRRYGRWLLAVAITGLLAYGGYLFWQSRECSAREVDGEAYHAMSEKLQAGQADAVDKELARLAVDGSPAYRAMAVIEQANQKIAAGDRKAAAILLSGVAKDDRLDPALRDLALIRQTFVEYDALDPAAVIARMQPIVGQKDPASPWFPSAAELAAIAHYQAGRLPEAGALFARIAAHPGVSDSLKSRTSQVAAMLGVATPDGSEGAVGEPKTGDAGGGTGAMSAANEG